MLYIVWTFPTKQNEGKSNCKYLCKCSSCTCNWKWKAYVGGKKK